MPPDPRRRVLDAGCGGAGTAAWVQGRGLGAVTGIELDPATARLARERHPDVTVVEGDLQRASAALAGAFDLFYSMTAIYAVPDQAAMFRELGALAAPGAELRLLEYADPEGRFAEATSGSPTWGWWHPLVPRDLPEVLAVRRLDLRLRPRPPPRVRPLVPRPLRPDRRQAPRVIEREFGRDWYEFVAGEYAGILDSSRAVRPRAPRRPCSCTRRRRPERVWTARRAAGPRAAGPSDSRSPRPKASFSASASAEEICASWAHHGACSCLVLPRPACTEEISCGLLDLTKVLRPLWSQDAASWEDAMDALDRRILTELQDDGRQTNARLAEALGLSQSATHDRVRRLERDGMIRGYRADVAPEGMGVGLQAFVAAELNAHSRGHIEDFERGILLVPGVRACYHITGRFDYLVQVAVRDLEHLGALIKIGHRLHPRGRQARDAAGAHRGEGGRRLAGDG